MIAEQKLSLKSLNARLKALEDLAYAESENPPEWLEDVLTGVIAALYHLRQQGAYSLAKELEAKYFPDVVVPVGDEITAASELHSAGRER